MDATFVTFVLDFVRQVCKNCSKEYECKMYNATSRNSSKVWWNQSHLIPKWTQKSSILENLYTNWSKSLRMASHFPPLACVKMCDLRFVDWANLLLQESKGQTYGLSPVWMRTWVRRLKSNENLLPQPSNVHCWEEAIWCKFYKNNHIR